MSHNRFLTTHVGSLPREDDLIELMFAKEDGQDIALAVYDADGGPAARAYVAALTGPGEGLTASRTDSVAACEAQVRGREALACVLLPAGFSGGIEGMLAGVPATIEVVVDPSRKAEAGLLTGKLMASGFRQLSAGLGDPAAMAGLLGRARATLAAEPGVPAPTRAALEQLYGGLGVVSEVPVERLYREIRALRIYEGASEVQQLIIGRELLKASPGTGAETR